MVSTKIRASDRTKACQQVVTVLKKQYGSRIPSPEFDVLDTLLHAICLENATFQQAQTSMDRMKASFFDYNEARVSSISELQNVFAESSHPEWRALRVRESLQYVFEGRYSFDLEDLKKKSLDASEKYFKKISSLTSFILNQTLMQIAGAHLVPIDENMRNAAIWMGLLEDETDDAGASDQFKSAIRKADVPLFFYLLNSLANDPRFQPMFHSRNNVKSDNPLDALNESSGLLKQLLAGKLPAPKPKPAEPAKKSPPPVTSEKKPGKEVKVADAKPAAKAVKKADPIKPEEPVSKKSPPKASKTKKVEKSSKPATGKSKPKK